MLKYQELMPTGQKAKCQSSSKTITERNLRNDIMLEVGYLVDLNVIRSLKQDGCNICLYWIHAITSWIYIYHRHCRIVEFSPETHKVILNVLGII